MIFARILRFSAILAPFLLLAPPFMAVGQSLLSQIPEEVTQNSTGGFGASAKGALPPEELFTLVDKGETGKAYPFLLEYYQRAKETLPPEKRYVDGLFDQLFLYLLVAGENLTPPHQQEELAQDFLEHLPSHRQAVKAYYQLVMAEARQNKALTTPPKNLLSSLSNLENGEQSRLYLALAAFEKKQNQLGQEASWLITESLLPKPHTTPDDILEALGRISRPKELEEVLKKHGSVRWLKNAAPLLEARMDQNEGRLDKALAKFAKLEDSGALRSSLERKFAVDAKEEAESSKFTRPERIGVILPLGSQSTAIRELAWDTLDGVRMALQFAQPSGQKLPYELVVRDTANSPEQAAALVEELVRLENVVAIIGPLARTESTAAFRKAEEMKVPLISLSLSADPPLGAEYSFKNAMSQADEVEALVSYAMGYRNARRFAIVYPNSAYGREMMELFWRKVESMGGTITGAGYYHPWYARKDDDHVGLKFVFDHMTGMDRFVSQEDQELMDEVGDKAPDPRVDFDAIYIPVEPNGATDLKQIASYPVTVNAENALLLGSSNMNSDEVAVAGGKRLSGAVFVDSFLRSGAQSGFAEFSRRHRQVFGHRPDYRRPTYFTAVAYDTVNILMRQTDHPENRTRRRLAISLKQMEPYPGLTGQTHFDLSGNAVKASALFQFRGQTVTPLALR